MEEGENHGIFLLFLSFQGKISFFPLKAALRPQKMGIIPQILILFEIPVGKGDLGTRVGISMLFLHPCAFPVKFPKDFPPPRPRKVVLGLVFFGMGGRKGGINELGAVAMVTCC